MEKNASEVSKSMKGRQILISCVNLFSVHLLAYRSYRRKVNSWEVSDCCDSVDPGPILGNLKSWWRRAWVWEFPFSS